MPNRARVWWLHIKHDFFTHSSVVHTLFGTLNFGPLFYFCYTFSERFDRSKGPKNTEAIKTTVRRLSVNQYLVGISEDCFETSLQSTFIFNNIIFEKWKTSCCFYFRESSGDGLNVSCFKSNLTTFPKMVSRPNLKLDRYQVFVSKHCSCVRLNVAPRSWAPTKTWVS